MCDSLTITAYLFSNAFISQDQLEFILSGDKIQSVKNHLLLDAIKDKKDAISCLFKVLRAEGEGHIVDHIIKTGKFPKNKKKKYSKSCP